MKSSYGSQLRFKDQAATLMVSFASVSETIWPVWLAEPLEHSVRQMLSSSSTFSSLFVHISRHNKVAPKLLVVPGMFGSSAYHVVLAHYHGNQSNAWRRIQGWTFCRSWNIYLASQSDLYAGACLQAKDNRRTAGSWQQNHTPEMTPTLVTHKHEPRHGYNILTPRLQKMLKFSFARTRKKGL